MVLCPIPIGMSLIVGFSKWNLVFMVNLNTLAKIANILIQFVPQKQTSLLYYWGSKVNLLTTRLAIIGGKKANIYPYM